MTRSDKRARMLTLPPRLRAWLPLLAVIALTAVVAAACAVPGASPVGSGSHPPTPAPTPLVPAQPGADPLSLLAWVFTPVFQALFIVLVLFYNLTGNIAIAIILLTLVIRALIIPLFRRQTISQKRMQMLQPEIKEIQRRYKGDRTKVSEATMALYKERGVSPAAGCLPLVLQFVLLIPMYSVIRDGLTELRPHRDAPHRAMAGSPDMPEPGQRRPHAATAVHRSHRLRDRLERGEHAVAVARSSAGSASWRWRRAFCSSCRAGW